MAGVSKQRLVGWRETEVTGLQRAGKEWETLADKANSLLPVNIRVSPMSTVDHEWTE